MKKKIALWVVSVLLVGMVVLYEMQINRAFEPVLRVYEYETNLPEVEPGDTLDASLRLVNQSWQLVEIYDKKGSCRVLRVLAPKTIRPKYAAYLLVRLVAQPQPGEHVENVVLRTNTKDVFEAAVVRYRVKAPTLAAR